MNQIPIKSTRTASGREGVFAMGGTFTLAGRDHPMHCKCVACDEKGTLLTWVDAHRLAHKLHAIAAESHTE